MSVSLSRFKRFITVYLSKLVHSSTSRVTKVLKYIFIHLSLSYYIFIYIQCESFFIFFSDVNLTQHYLEVML